jgi:hypothetical protein
LNQRNDLGHMLQKQGMANPQHHLLHRYFQLQFDIDHLPQVDHGCLV